MAETPPHRRGGSRHRRARARYHAWRPLRYRERLAFICVDYRRIIRRLLCMAGADAAPHYGDAKQDRRGGERAPSLERKSMIFALPSTHWLMISRRHANTTRLDTGGFTTSRHYRRRRRRAGSGAGAAPAVDTRTARDWRYSRGLSA